MAVNARRQRKSHADPDAGTGTEPAVHPELIRLRAEAASILADAPSDIEEARSFYAVAMDKQARAEGEIDPDLPYLTPIQRQRAPKYLALLANGYRPRHIAAALELGIATVRADLYVMKKCGYMEDALARIDKQLIPLAIDTVADAIEDGNAEIAVEALKGRGVFRTYNQVKNEGVAPNNTLALQIIMPDGRELNANDPKLLSGEQVIQMSGLEAPREGSIVGVAMTDDTVREVKDAELL